MSTSPLSLIPRIRFWHVLAMLVAATAVLFVAVPKVEAADLTAVSVTYTAEASSPSGTRFEITATAGTSSTTVRIVKFDVPGSSVLANNATFIITPNGGVATSTGTVVLSSNTITITADSNFTMNSGGASTISVDGLIITTVGTWGSEGTVLELTTELANTTTIDGPTNAGAGNVTIIAAAAGTNAVVQSGVSNRAHFINEATKANVTVRYSQSGNFAATLDTLNVVLVGSSGAALAFAAVAATDVLTQDFALINVTNVADGTVTIYAFFLDSSVGNFSAATAGSPTATKDVVVPSITGVATNSADDSLLDVTFNTGVYSSANGTGALAADGSNFAYVAQGGGASADLVSHSAGNATATFDLAGAANTSTPGTLAAANSMAIFDAAGNPATTGPFSITDGTDPTVSGVDSDKTPGTYKAGETINITVTFDESVVVSDGLRIQLNTGGMTP